MAMQSSYYSGALEGINRGRTADAAVDAADSASFRNLVASIAANRTRENLGNRELGIREALGTGELALRGELGRGEIGVRRDIGLGEIGVGNRRVDEMALDRGVRRELGLGALTQAAVDSSADINLRLKELDASTRLKQQEIDAYNRYLQQGGATDWREARAIAQLEREKAMELAEAEALANQLSQQALAATKGKNIPGWWDSDPERAAAFTNNPAFQGEITQGVLSGVPPSDAALVEFDPAQTRFVPRRSLFGRPSMATPGINPTLPSPVDTINATPVAKESLFRQWQRGRQGR